MKLVLYLYKKFFSVFLGSLFFFILVLSLTDLLMNIWNYTSRAVPADQIAMIMLYYIPKTVWYAVPISMLFTTSYVLSDLSAKNELIAVFASGVSLFRFTAPISFIDKDTSQFFCRTTEQNCLPLSSSALLQDTP